MIFMAIKKRKHPQFLRPNYGRKSRSRIKRAWRRPRGIDNKKRLKIAYMGASPSIGYGQPSEIKHFHPAGMKELPAQSPADLANAKNVLIRIASGVGRKKRAVIEQAAKAAGLRVLNPMHERKKDREKKENKAARLAKVANKEAAKKAEEQKRQEAQKAEAAKKAEAQKKAEEAKGAAAQAQKPAAPQAAAAQNAAAPKTEAQKPVSPAAEQKK